jgi:hypothetical protein
MGWFTRKKKTSEAEQSLARLQEQSGSAREPEIYVTVWESPTVTTPGTPISCYNESDPVRVGQEVQVFGSTFVEQRGRIMAMTRDGVPIETLEYGEKAEVVLDDGVDLGEVFRGGCLVSPSDTRVESTHFTMQVLRAEPRGADALVVGRVASGQIAVGDMTIATHGGDEQTVPRRVLAVEPMGAELGVVIEGRAAHSYLYGDEVSGYGTA